MQATVRTFDPVRRSGTVLLDDGTEIPYERDALLGSGVRLLRSGQRVRVEVEGGEPAAGVATLGDHGGDLRVRFLTIATLPDRR